MFEFLVTPVFLWLAFMVIFLAAEIITVGLTSIWFAGGALVALIAAMAGISPVIQVVLFLAVSILLLIFTRPFAVKYVKPHNVKTNYEELIGKEVQITQRIDNREGTGKAVFNGQARSITDETVWEAGAVAHVAEIRGVKLLVK